MQRFRHGGPQFGPSAAQRPDLYEHSITPLPEHRPLPHQLSLAPLRVLLASPRVFLSAVNVARRLGPGRVARAVGGEVIHSVPGVPGSLFMFDR